MSTTIDPTRPQADLNTLHPKWKGRFVKLSEQLILAHQDKKTATLFLPFEAYRFPQRQALLKLTTKNTKADAFESAHQFGLAVDFVPWDSTWSWDERHDWDFLRLTSRQFGLDVPLGWDKAHVEAPCWKVLFQEMRALI